MISTSNSMYIVKIKHRDTVIYPKPTNRFNTLEADAYMNECYYTYEKLTVANETYYELRRSSISPAIGWVAEKHIRKELVIELPIAVERFEIKGTGMCYSHPSGGKNDQLYPALNTFRDQVFYAAATWQVGKRIWHLGKIGDTTAWIENIHLRVVAPL